MTSRFQQNSGTASRRSRQVSLTSTISVYSTTAPSMSRASSERILDTLDTPIDGCFSASVSLGPETLAPRDYNDTQSTMRKNEPYDRFARNRLVPDAPVLTRIHVPPMELSSSLEYRRSTRELISKFEAISGPGGTPPSIPPAHRPLCTPPALPSLQRRNSPLPELPTTTKLKTQTPFSFRSLLTVFGKKSKSPRPAQSEACVSVTRPVIPQVEDVFSTPVRDQFSFLYRSDRISAPFSYRTCPIFISLHPSSPMASL